MNGSPRFVTTSRRIYHERLEARKAKNLSRYRTQEVEVAAAAPLGMVNPMTLSKRRGVGARAGRGLTFARARA